MNVHVGGLRRDHGLKRVEEGVDGQQVRLRAAHHEMNVRIRRAAQLADPLRGLLAVVVQTVAAGLFQIGLGQRTEDGGVRALTVVVAEMIHG